MNYVLMLCGVSMDYPWRINGCISCILLCLENRPGWSFSWTRRVSLFWPSHPCWLVSQEFPLWGPFFFGNGLQFHFGLVFRTRLPFLVGLFLRSSSFLYRLNCIIIPGVWVLLQFQFCNIII